MDRVKMEQTRQWVRDELDRCAAFWLEHGMDREHGGVYTLSLIHISDPTRL